MSTNTRSGSKRTQRNVYDTILHKLPEDQSTTDTRSPYTIKSIRSFTPHVPLGSKASPSEQTRRVKKYKPSRHVEFNIEEQREGYFDVPTKIRVMALEEHLPDDVNRINILKEEMMHILTQPIGSVLQDMIVLRKEDPGSDDEYNFNEDQNAEIIMMVEDVLLNKKYDMMLVHLHDQIDQRPSKEAEEAYMDHLSTYTSFLESNKRTPLYEIIQQAYNNNVESTYRYMLRTANGKKEFDKETVTQIVHGYIHLFSSTSLPSRLLTDLNSFVNKHAQNIKNEAQFQYVLLEASKRVSIYLHTKSFEYITALLLLGVLTTKSRISCRNHCSAMTIDGFFPIDLKRKEVDTACLDMYTTMKSLIGKHEIDFFIKILMLASGGKCVLLNMSGGKNKKKSKRTRGTNTKPKQNIHQGPRGGKYMIVNGKKKYL